MAELERALAALAALQATTAPAQAAAALAPTGPSLPLPGRQPVPAPGQQQQQSVSAAEGMVLYKLFKVYREAQALYHLKDSSSRYSDWPHMRADLLSMSQPEQSVGEKLDLHRRMLRTYCVLQP